MILLRKNYEAVLFDMDGTLLDSRVVVERIWREWAAKYELDAKKILANCHGRRTIDVVKEFCPNGIDFSDESAEIDLAEIADTNGIAQVAEATKFVENLQNVPWAIVTSAGRELATRRLAAAQIPLPPTLIAAEDITFGKPDPEGYIRAAEVLGVDIKKCLVFEDAPAGIEAAKAAGCEVVAITATHPYRLELECPSIRDFRSIKLV